MIVYFLAVVRRSPLLSVHRSRMGRSLTEMTEARDGGALNEVAEELSRMIGIERRILEGAQRMAAMPGSKREQKSRRVR